MPVFDDDFPSGFEVPVLSVRAGDHLVTIAREVGRERWWLSQVDAPRRWMAEVSGLAGAYRTDPSQGNPHWLIAGVLDGAGGLGADAQQVTVAAGNFQITAAIEPRVWAVVLPPIAATWALVLNFSDARGVSVSGAMHMDQLLTGLGSCPEDSPDGSGWTPYAPITPAC